jgi:spore maturation protein CgeB
MGHEVEPLGSTYPARSSKIGALFMQFAESSRALTQRLQSRIVAGAKSANCDVVLAVEGTLSPESVERLKGNGSAVALWFGDAVSDLGRQLMFLADYDLVCFKDSELVRRARAALGGNVIYLPEACNPSWHQPCDVMTEPVVVVAGNMHAFRMRLLERLARVGIPLQIYGPPWASWLRSDVLWPSYSGRYIARHDKARVFRSAGVLLNTLRPGEMASVNCRLFEAAGCGAAVLTEVRPDLCGLFEVDAEVAGFETFDVLIDRIRWMLDHPAEARVMGDRAATRAQAEHTYDQRLGMLLTALS